MNIKPFAATVIGIALVGFAVLESRRNTDLNTSAGVPSQSRPLFSETRTSDAGAVSITVTPENISSYAKTWNFQVTMNTHSAELSDDLVKVSTLFDENGNKYTPLRWGGDPPGGHHRNGVLVFNPLPTIPESITLKIYSVGGISEREFSWPKTTN